MANHRCACRCGESTKGIATISLRRRNSFLQELILALCELTRNSVREAAEYPAADPMRRVQGAVLSKQSFQIAAIQLAAEI